MADPAAAAATPASVADVYMTGRLMFSLLVGFVVGVVTTLAIGVDKLANVDPAQVTQPGGAFLLLLLAGYAGTDAVEGLVNRFVPSPGP
jgi:hypothetical protein